MPDVWSTDKLILFIAFFLPGFISLQVYRLFVAGDDNDIGKKLPAIVAYSAMHYAVFGGVILLSSGAFKAVATFVIVLILPAVWPIVILLARDFGKWSEVFWPPHAILGRMLKPEPTPWDWVFNNDGCFVRIKLNDDSFVGGKLGGGSAVSTFPNDQQIFIAQEYRVDQVSGELGDPIASTGIFVNGSEIKLIELIGL